MNRTFAQWSLFLAMVFTVPVIFFLFQIVLLAPLGAIIIVSFKMGTGLLILGLIHTILFGPILWFTSRTLVRVLERVHNTRVRIAAYITAIAALIFIAWLGPYSVGGHSNDQTLSWLQTFHPY